MPLDPDDFTRLYRRHAQHLLVHFQRRLLDAEWATDLVAETFAIAIERADQFRGTTDAELSGWLWAIARSTLSDHLRRDGVARRSRGRLVHRQLSRDEIGRVEELAGTEDLRLAVALELERLPAALREAVRLRVVEERPYPEVAGRLGISELAVRARVSRGLRALGDALDADAETWTSPS